MERVRKLPAAFKRYQKIGGALEFAVFGDASGSMDETMAAIRSAIHHRYSFDPDRLAALGARPMRERRFFGDWYDPDDEALIKVGEWQTEGGEQLRNPKLNKLDRIRIRSGGFLQPDPGSGGQFAYAFTQPPYSLDARPSEVQALFDDVRAFIMPAQCSTEILDWSSPDLPSVSNYFAAGMEWWGVFLFTLRAVDLRRLTVVLGSTTD